MNPFLILLAAVSLSVMSVSAAYAVDRQTSRQHHVRNEPLIAVSVDSGDLHSLNTRVRLLEEAVRRLQERCVRPEPQAKWTCKVKGMGGNVFYGQGVTQGEAEMQAVQKCQTRYSGIHCQMDGCS